MADLEKAMDTLSSMLSSEEGKQTLSDMVDSFTSDSSTNELLNMDTMLKVKNIMDEFQSGNDRRSNLLMALKPYLNNARLGRIDETINLLKITKLPGLIKGIRR